MCELLGIAFNEPVTASIAFRGFRYRGRENRDGWGLAWFTNNEVQIRKEPAPASQSEQAKRLVEAKDIRSPIFIAHVRLKSRGECSYENTHPFQRTLRGAPVVFAHNGTLNGLQRPRRLRPQGSTDSETAFCLLLEWMEDEDLSFSDFVRIEEWLQWFNKNGKMNLLFSDGQALFAYRDSSGYNSLYLTYREAPFSKIKLKDEDLEVDLAGEKKPSEKGFIIATNELTNEHWYELQEGRLLVVKGGEIVYGDPRA